MKEVELLLSKITIGDYYGQLDQVNFRIHYNDGKDHVLSKQIKIENPQKHTSEWLTEIRKDVKKRHSELTLDDDPLAGALIIKYAQETDAIQDKMARFLKQVQERIRSGKLAKTSYWDLERQIKGMQLKLT